MTYLIEHYIYGKMVSNTTPHFSAIHNPATGERIGQVALGTESEANAAVAAAKQAFPGWAEMPIQKRAQIFLRYQALLKQHLDELAQLITAEHGKTLNDARGSIQRGIDVVEFACAIPALLSGRFTENVGSDVDSYSIRQPLGVSVGITPFNFPAMIPLWMFPIALLCGNTFVLKPSEKDPACSLRLAGLLTEAGLPPGVLNVVQGDKTVVDILLRHADVKTVSFVGSSDVAQYVYQTATQHGKRAQAFGSAKNHGIVMPDADLNQTVDAFIGAAYGSAGQRCMALPVAVIVGDKMADQFVAVLKTRIETLKIGSGTEPQTEMGPVISRTALQRIQTIIDSGIAEGAVLVTDGRQKPDDVNPQGYFMKPCLFDRVEPNMRIYREEIFGPVLCVVRVPDFEAALQLVNEHPYGNGTAIFTRDGHFARMFASRVQVGMIGINVPIPVPVAYHNFGGWKGSVFGDTHLHGPDSLHFYTKQKTITARWFADVGTGAEFVMPTVK